MQYQECDDNIVILEREREREVDIEIELGYTSIELGQIGRQITRA